ncbi:hypothetical protein H6S82_00510 [Planktothrix sp. FACHB-1355]|uniref:glycosyltransferase n=1 Tax=Planktothrix sp. FACHB-1355 TaxID=2692854 RepID=UPI00168B5E53|nr:nucleotide disphospho-sugar-binding domain-containing protein [Planktothrix sp. FACHB-1355]MBD3557351.1 hypothetical protein [Planktothrix sp. FACHB-1355]
MKVLFTFLYRGGLAHLNPLIALHYQCRRQNIETAFLVPRFRHEFLKKFNLNVLDIDHQPSEKMGFRTEIQAYGKYKPDVVIDDMSMTTQFAAQVSQLPRITIQRTGIFPFETRVNPKHQHSMDPFDISKIPKVSFLGIPQPRKFTDLFAAEGKIVPGIRSLEVLPPQIAGDPGYFFAGPLIIDDFIAEAGNQQLSFTSVSKENPNIENLRDFSSLRQFFETNGNRKTVYLTYGTIAVGDAPPAIDELIKYLLSEGVAVVSSVPLVDVEKKYQPLYFFSRYLPMHFVCERVDLMIHHCGSGTYHYPIIHNVPTIIIGTRCFDREEVAYRLAEKGAASFLPDPVEEPEFLVKIKKLIDSGLNDAEFIKRQKNQLSRLKSEIDRTVSEFNIREVVESVLRAKQTLRMKSTIGTL